MRVRFLLPIAACIVALAGCDSNVSNGPAPDAIQPKLGLQAWTYRDLPLTGAIQKAADLNIAYIEAFPGQKIGGDIEGEFHHTMPEDARKAVLDFAKDKGVKIVSYGVVGGKDEAEWNQIFDFAKAMNLEWISSEPPVDTLPLVAKLAKESGVKVALHNHPTPSTYANPAFTMKAIEPYGPEIGLCADTGHWARSGFDPLATLRECMDRVVALHFKDLNELGVKEARDVPWGTGTCDAAGMIAALRTAGFKGVALTEYEHSSPHLDDEVARCAEFFRAAVAAPIDDLIEGKVAPPGYSVDANQEWAEGRGNASEKWPSPEPLLKPDLSNAIFPEGAWTYEDGVLKGKGGAGDLWTKEDYGDFALSLEFRCGEKTNSGIFIRCSDIVNWLHNAIEVQILQGDEPDQKHVVGAIFDVMAPTRQLPIEPGEWNSMTIVARGSRIHVRLNGEDIIDMNLDDWTEPHKNPDGTPNKFEKAYKDMARSGRIGFQDHGDPIEFRNILIEKLPPPKQD